MLPEPGRSALRLHRRPRRRLRHPARHALHAGDQPGHARRAGRLRTARHRLSGYARRPAPGAGRDRPDRRGPRLRQLSAVHPRRHAGADSRGPAAPAWRQRGAAHWAATAGITERTLLRHCQQHLGMPFNEWRQRLRVVSALEMLDAGHPVQTVARELGYSTPSAFIAMFQRLTGQSPDSARKRPAAPA
ncbi:helix-turn-helix domain-containing protein [Achromobacter insuavis]